MVTEAAIPAAPPKPTAPDPRRISEDDVDFQRVRSFWLRRLLASVRTLVSDIRRGGPHAVGPAQSAFIHRHTLLLQQAYLAAHRQGQLDYWEAVSKTPRKWARSRATQPSVAQAQRRLLFYAAASVTKMAREAEVAYNQSKRPRAAATLADPPADLAFDQFAAWASPRVGLQVDITWSGFQDGYLEAASADMAGLRLQVWVDLDPSAQHCDDCLQRAAGSPYDAPGSGGNELTSTPGDGQTACGAADKCGLRYGYSDLAGAGLGAPGDNEVFLQPGETPSMVGRPPLPPAGPTPSDWEALHVQQLARGLGVEPPPLFGRGAPAPPAGEATGEAEQSPWEQWYRQHIAPLMPAGYVDPIFDGAGIANVEAEGEVLSPEAQAWAEAIKNSPFATDYDREIVESMLINGKVVRNIARTGPDLAPIEGLTDGQKGALDQMRGVALLWDAVRDELPAFEVYFDPDSRMNVWGNPNLDGLDETQRELVKRFFGALRDWEDATPLDESDEMQFAEPSDGGMLLYNPYARQAGGRWGFGPGGREGGGAAGRAKATRALAKAAAKVAAVQARWEAAPSHVRSAMRDEVQTALWKHAKAQAALDRVNGGRGAIILAHSYDQPFEAQARLDEATHQMFGHTLSRDELGGLVGAPEGAAVTINGFDYGGGWRTGLTLEMHGPSWTPADVHGLHSEYNAERYLLPAHGGWYMNNSGFFVSDDYRSQGIGTRIFSDEVNTLSSLHVRYIETNAAGGGNGTLHLEHDESNGFYTWPRFGYTGHLPSYSRGEIGKAVSEGRLPKAFEKYTTIQQVMRSRVGRDWWKANGEELDGLRFDLRQGSLSRRVLASYLDGQTKKQGSA